MKDKAKIEELPVGLGSTCPNCESSKLTTSIESETFKYGGGDKAVELTASIPVLTCLDCNFQFTDETASEIRHDAVCRHLGVMTPKEVKSIRLQYTLSRQEFADISRIGEASIARWEAGLLIQSAAYDEYLHLLSFRENFERVQKRERQNPVEPASRNPSVSNAIASRVKSVPKLRVIKNHELIALTLEASQFPLRRTGTNR